MHSTSAFSKNELPGSRLNIKMSYKYSDSHYKYKTVLQPTYLYNGNPYVWKDCCYIEIGPSVSLSTQSMPYISWIQIKNQPVLGQLVTILMG